MTRYIVKNCPSYGITTPTSCALTSDDSCEFTDCRIKQIAKICLKTHRLDNESIGSIAEDILRILDVRRVNNA